MDLYLVRHGESTFNADGRVQGHLNSELTVNGRQQARSVAARLASEDLEAIYASIMDRSLTTATIIAERHGLDIRSREGLCGIDMGLDAGRPATEIEDEVMEAEENDRYWSPRKGEDPKTFHDRITHIIDRIIRRHDGSVCIVGHAGIIRTFLIRYRDENVYEAYQIPQDNCAINIINVERQRVKRVNDTEHLP